ncbi:MAG: ABC transporter permease, partial [Armatimonadota bacterium]|nr:ABC transporter permease [Armatimonadota bacterium]
MGEVLDIELLRSALRLATPLALAAMGGILSERSGVVNIGLEGQMLMGAFVGWAAAVMLGNGWLGVVCGVGAGALLGFLHALLTQRFRADHVVSGMAVNLLAAGLTVFLLRRFFERPPGAPGIAEWSLGWLQGVPLLGGLLAQQSPFVFLMLALPPVLHVLLYHTMWGLRVRAAGESARKSRLAGIDVVATRYACVTLSGVLAALAGTYLSLSQLNVFSEGMSAGRGFIALAAVIFGRWTPLGATVAALGFGFLDALQQRLQGETLFGVRVPSELLLSLPYLLTIVALAGLVGRSVP